MGDLFQGLALFSNINLFKSKSADAKGKYTLCYFPLAGVIVSIIVSIWYSIVTTFNINFVIAALVSAVIFASVVGNKCFYTVMDFFGKAKIIAVLLYGVFIFAVFYLSGQKGAFVIPAVLVLSRVTAMFMIIDNDRLEEGFYRELVDRANKVVVAIITVVWLMAAVAFFEMLNFVCFVLVFVTAVAVYLAFSCLAKKKHRLTDKSVNCYIVCLDAFIYAEIMVLSFLGRV